MSVPLAAGPPSTEREEKETKTSAPPEEEEEEEEKQAKGVSASQVLHDADNAREFYDEQSFARDCRAWVNESLTTAIRDCDAARAATARGVMELFDRMRTLYPGDTHWARTPRDLQKAKLTAVLISVFAIVDAFVDGDEPAPAVPLGLNEGGTPAPPKENAVTHFGEALHAFFTEVLFAPHDAVDTAAPPEISETRSGYDAVWLVREYIFETLRRRALEWGKVDDAAEKFDYLRRHPEFIYDSTGAGGKTRAAQLAAYEAVVAAHPDLQADAVHNVPRLYEDYLVQNALYCAPALHGRPFAATVPTHISDVRVTNDPLGDTLLDPEAKMRLAVAETGHDFFYNLHLPGRATTLGQIQRAFGVTSQQVAASAVGLVPWIIAGEFAPPTRALVDNIKRLVYATTQPLTDTDVRAYAAVLRESEDRVPATMPRQSLPLPPRAAPLAMPNAYVNMDLDEDGLVPQDVGYAEQDAWMGSAETILSRTKSALVKANDAHLADLARALIDVGRATRDTPFLDYLHALKPAAEGNAQELLAGIFGMFAQTGVHEALDMRLRALHPPRDLATDKSFWEQQGVSAQAFFASTTLDRRALKGLLDTLLFKDTMRMVLGHVTAVSATQLARVDGFRNEEEIATFDAMLQKFLVDDEETAAPWIAETQRLLTLTVHHSASGCIDLASVIGCGHAPPVVSNTTCALDAAFMAARCGIYGNLLSHHIIDYRGARGSLDPLRAVPDANSEEADTYLGRLKRAIWGKTGAALPATPPRRAPEEEEEEEEDDDILSRLETVFNRGLVATTLELLGNLSVGASSFALLPGLHGIPHGFEEATEVVRGATRGVGLSKAALVDIRARGAAMADPAHLGNLSFNHNNAALLSLYAYLGTNEGAELTMRVAAEPDYLAAWPALRQWILATEAVRIKFYALGGMSPMRAPQEGDRLAVRVKHGDDWAVKKADTTDPDALPARQLLQIVLSTEVPLAIALNALPLKYLLRDVLALHAPSNWQWPGVSPAAAAAPGRV